MSQYAELTLKPINDLLSLSFFIPAYQRGYRWSSRQVIELLEDVYEFCDRKHPKDEDFYCLQPVVVKQKLDSQNTVQWELVDGQQRLTTILLILGYFNNDLLRILESIYIRWSMKLGRKAASIYSR